MNAKRWFVLFVVTALFCCLVLPSVAQDAAKKKNKYACTEPNPETLCTAANTCGSASTPCVVDIKKDSNLASAKAMTSNPKNNALFCIKAGTSLTFQSVSKNTGFVIDFGPNSPFDSPDAIIGGANKPATVTPKKPGCYKYSVGACVSGAIYGMCGDSSAEAIVVK